MKKLLLFAAPVIFLAPALSAAPPQPITASLTLPSSVVLPGVPFDMTVTLTNNSSAQASVGLLTRFAFRLPDGTTFSPRAMHLLDPNPYPIGQTWVTLSAGESRQFYVQWASVTPDIFHFSEFSGPGAYDVTLALSASKTDDDYVGEIVTNAAHLTRIVPAGQDGALWNRMSAAMDGRWADDGFWNSRTGPAILREILELHPESAYYPYAILLREQISPPTVPTTADVERLLTTADRFPSSPAYPHLLLRAAAITDGFAVDAMYRHDMKARSEYLRTAERYYDDAANKVKIPILRRIAERQRDATHAAIERDRLREASKRIQQ